MKCTVCDGTSIIFTYSKAVTCPTCKGSGKALEKPKSKYKIAIVGDTWTDSESAMMMPFVGSVGDMLNEILEEAGINRSECFLTHVFNLTPRPKNDVMFLCTSRAESSVPLPDLYRGKYLQDRYYPEVQRLWEELKDIKPNLIIAAGAAALWALTGNSSVKSLRGTVLEATFGPKGTKIIPTYSISNIFRDWSSRPIITADFIKSARQAEYPEIRRPSRKIWVEPDIRDIDAFYEMHIKRSNKLSVDIETAHGQITCIGFAPSDSIALVVPFVDYRKPDGSYWPTAHQEKLAWGRVKTILQHVDKPEIQILGQNFLYDINWLWKLVGLPPRNFLHDTMLKHHAMQMEMEKGLGFLGSIYTDEPAWKLMRKNTDSTKRGE